MHSLDGEKTYSKIHVFAQENTAVSGLAVTPGAEGVFHSTAMHTGLVEVKKIVQRVE